VRRYPLEPLVAASGLSEAALARSVGLSGSTLQQARLHGLREDAADRYAVRAGFVPVVVWPDFGQAICPECSEPFVQSRRTHVMCSDNCRERRRMRLKYQSDPAWAEAKRAARRAYYQECADYERADARRRYWQDPDRARELRRQRHRRTAA
jgi:hypothetical protein